ncbi:MAG TPA: GTPase ObgE [Candidatus Paceibacterota bacterium]|nr:GTPase ObgE [Candidatus Paceibacterota bacterium]
MLIDEIKITVKAGDGGDGKVAFNRNIMSLGPTGASGGNGGNVYVEGVSDMSVLERLRFTKIIKAENGGNGQEQFRDGHTGKEAIILVPAGTIVTNLNTGAVYDILQIGDKVMIAQGGHGGKGNFLFRSSKNTSPKQFQKGLLGEKADFHLELKLIADIGLIGLPSVGKSSLLNNLTRANAKVANYPFTTLEPNLGVFYTAANRPVIIADIPGLIEGASQGKGLGAKFLRHIERTRVLWHLLSVESDDLIRDYTKIKKELLAYNKALGEKPEIVIFTKIDSQGEENNKKTQEAQSYFKKLGIKTIAVSNLTGEGLDIIKNEVLEKWK